MSSQPVWKPVVHLDAAFGVPHLKALHEGLSEIIGNIDFVQQELPNVRVPEAAAAQIRTVFSDFYSCCYDVRTEIKNLTDKLGLGDPDHPCDPGIANPDPRVTMGFIGNWLHAEFEKLHVLVQSLTGDKSSAYLLVAESAVNMLNAFAGIHAALEQIAAAVAPLLPAGQQR
jgi:hypothetical protein